MSEQLLSGYRVLDLASEGVEIGGAVLADLGADVVKVEPPGGDPDRRIGPFYKDIPDPNKSLWFWAYNVNKRGVTLNLDTADGQEIFKELVKTAHFVVESFPPGYMKERGLGYEEMSKINPRIIMTSVTPFGQTGPYSKYKGSDLIMQAMGGHMFSTGDRDRPPVRISSPTSYLHAGIEAAVASLIAHWHREHTGEGQFVDVAIQPCVVWTTMDTTGYWAMEKVNKWRAGPGTFVGISPIWMPTIYECKDGYTNTFIMGGGTYKGFTKGLVEWIIEEGMAPDWFHTFDFKGWVPALAPPEVTKSVMSVIGPFLATKTRWELMENAVKRDFSDAAIQDPQLVRESPQLEARDFWEEIEHPELGEKITYPSHWIRFHQYPVQRTRRAPLIGEHNEEIYEGELKLSKERLVLLQQAGVF